MTTYQTFGGGTAVAAANIVKFFPPVASGLLGWYDFSSGSLTTAVKDKSGNGNNLTISGTPTVNSGYINFTGQNGGQWFQSPITEGTDLTIVLLARTLDALTSSATRPQFFSSDTVGSGSDPISAAHGCYLTMTGPTGSAAVLTGQTQYNNGGTIVPRPCQPTIGNPATWGIYTFTITSATGVSVLTNATNGDTASATQSPLYPRANNLNAGFRIGGGYQSSGICDINHISFYSRALSSTELASVVARVRATALGIAGITA